MNAALGAIGTAWLLGALIVAAFWPRGRSLRSDAALILAAGIGVGLGATSILFFIASQVAAAPRMMVIGAELVLGVSLAGAVWIRRGHRPATPAAGRGISWIEVVAATLFVQGGLLAAVAASRAYAAEPFGSMDAWAIWNMHARFLFRGGEDWPRLLQQPQLGWSHLDYPLLVSASVARGWALAGRDTPLMAGLIAVAFAVGAVGLLVTAAATLHSRLAGWLGGLVLLGTPFFVTFAPNQHADIPLGFFILATLALGAMSRRAPESPGLPALAGICAGLAAWTKNEGLLFAAVVGAGAVAAGLRAPRRRATIAFLSALAVALLPTAYFKFALAPANDLVSAGIGTRLGYLFDGARHGVILSAIWRDAPRFGAWTVVPFVAMILPLLGAGWRRWSRAETALAAAIGVTAVGYYAVYLLTPWDLAWHLETSLVRLMLQLWPAGVFFWCLGLPVWSPARSPAPSRPAWVALGSANLLIAAGILVLLSRQLAANEMAATGIGAGRTSLVAGAGWFAPETDGRFRWQWSTGDSVLLLHRRGDDPVTRTLRFQMRGLGRRTVQIRLGERIVWQGRVSENLTGVEIPGLLVPGGTTALRLISDTPAIPESNAPGARPLAFALYNPDLQ